MSAPPAPQAPPQRPGAGRRRVLRILSWVLFAVAAVAALEATLTLAWKEPVTAALQWRSQQELARELERAVTERRPAGGPARAVAQADGARDWRAQLRDGDAVGRLTIPAIGIDEVVIEGTTSGLLQRGPGHYPETGLPGMGGTSAIAGHRTTWGAPFRHLDELDEGDPIAVELPYGRFDFRVSETRIVDDQDRSILDGPGERLVLTACHPLYSASQRLVVIARPAPRGPAGRPA
jgi:sortase A